jgi:N-formylglutamate amidohydrolase
VNRGWTIRRGPDPILATAIHAGHEIRPEVAALCALPEEVRLREEDPLTDEWLWYAANSVAVARSRFELDLNRPREAAVYLKPEDAWGLELWTQPLPDAIVNRSLEIYDSFYEDLAAVCDELADEFPRFVVFDVHSYNHRRGGPDAPVDDPAENPEINVGTGSVDEQWRNVVDCFIESMSQHPFDGGRLDVGENIRFRGGHMSRWLNERYAGRGCAIAIEVKKIYMDEWTGHADEGATVAVGEALAAAADAVRSALGT